ncbi:regulator of sigma E protease [Advenella incenata]|uniref:Zinc metalloprotease n=1 Tax=Advenella incenata TaxID=267800 RepID=A0A4V2FU18_9BURK|nr:RIP metalloprotease RseP [Advenella incenata]RZU00266.1 regulator of sigma E protease [Advenella incenata]
MFSSIIFFIVTISIVVVFHELGHYLAARLCGVHVERFSLGFGKVLLSRRDTRGTEWVISALPLGGYVKPLAEPEAGAMDRPGRGAMSEKSPWQRMLIFAAGPAFSLLLGILIYSVMYMAGSNVPQAILGTPAAGTPAQVAGVKKGDRVIGLNGRNVHSWTQLQQQLLEPMILGQSVTLQLRDQSNNDRDATIALLPAPKDLEGVNLSRLNGLDIDAPPPSAAQVISGGAGEAAGIKQGDVIVQAGAHTDLNARAFIEEIEKNAGQDVPLVVLRDGQRVTLNVTPRPTKGPDGVSQGKIGVALQSGYPMTFVRYGLVESVALATTRTLDTAWFSVKMLGKMVIGQVSWKNISGPVTIADYAGKSASLGFERFIEFIALITISIGVLNLIPIPGLDGGQMLFAFFEIVRGRPLPAFVQEKGLALGYMLLLALMVVAFLNDVMRITG